MLILLFSYHFDNNNHQLKSSFAVEDSKTSIAISELIKQGDNNLEIIRDFHKAIEFYNTVLEIDPENVDVLSKKGKALTRLYNFSEAQMSIDKSFEISPLTGIVFNSKGFLLYNQGNYSEAIKYFDKAIEINPNNSIVLTNIAYGLALYSTNLSQAIKLVENH